MILTVIHRHRNVLVAAATFGAAVYFAAPSEPRVESGAPSGVVKRVEVGEVTSSVAQRELRFSGVIRAADRARLGFALGGRLISRSVEVGQTVAKGQVLAHLDDLEVSHALAGARSVLKELQARRAQAERDVQRAESLAAAKAATPEEVEKTRAGLLALSAAEDAAASRVQETERLMSETVLKAPFAGMVTEIFFEPGELLTPGRPLLVLSGQGELELEVEVPESVIGELQVGDEVEIRNVRAGRSLGSTIHSVGRTSMGPGTLFPVVARLAGDQGWVAGSTAELVLSLAEREALSVPVEAVINPGGRRPSVYRLERGDGDTRVRRVPVEVGDLHEDRVVVHGELEAGDQVVVGGQRGLLDGEPVDVVRGDR